MKVDLVVFSRLMGVAITMMALWWSSSSFALGLGLGDLKLTSNLSSPLKASVVLKGMDSINLDPDQFSILIGGDSNHQIEYRLLRMDGDSAVIDLYTRQAIAEPLFQFRIEVKWGNSTVARVYDVLLDPPAYRDYFQAEKITASIVQPSADPAQTNEQIQFASQLEPVALSGGASTAVAAATENPIIEPAMDSLLQDAAAVDEKIPNNMESPREYGPTTDGTSLWKVARAVAPDKSEPTIFQWMYAIWDANPKAFTRTNMHRLKTDELLSIPHDHEVAATSREQSWRFFGIQMALLQPVEASPVVVTVANETSQQEEVTLIELARQDMLEDASLDRPLLQQPLLQQKLAQQEKALAEAGLLGVTDDERVVDVGDTDSQVTPLDEAIRTPAEVRDAIEVARAVIALPGQSASIIDQESMVVGEFNSVSNAPQESLSVDEINELEAAETSAAEIPTIAPVIMDSEVAAGKPGGETFFEGGVIPDSLEATASDGLVVMSTAQQEMAVVSHSGSIDSAALQAVGWSAALLSRRDYINQMPLIGAEGSMAFIGRAVQTTDRFVATSPSWAALAFGAWVTLMLMMLRQELLARRAAAASLRVSTSTLEEEAAADDKSTPLSAGQAVEKFKDETRSELQPKQSRLAILLLELYDKTRRAQLFDDLLYRSKSVFEKLDPREQIRPQVMHTQLCPNLDSPLGHEDPFDDKDSVSKDLPELKSGPRLRVGSENQVPLDELVETVSESSDLVPDCLLEVQDDNEFNVESQAARAVKNIDDLQPGEDVDKDNPYIETQVIFTDNGVPLREDPDSMSGMFGEILNLEATLKEADVYLAYGLYDNAEELLLKGMEVDPKRADFLARLLDAYYATRNVVDFESCAEALLDMGKHGREYLDNMEIMGFELAPYNTMFSGGKDRSLNAVALEISRPETTDFEFSDIEQTSEEAYTDFEMDGNGDVVPQSPDLNLDLEANEFDDITDVSELIPESGGAEVAQAEHTTVVDLEAADDAASITLFASTEEQLACAPQAAPEGDGPVFTEEAGVVVIDSDTAEDALVFTANPDEILALNMGVTEDEVDALLDADIQDDQEIDLDDGAEEVMDFVMDEELESEKSASAGDDDDTHQVMGDESTLTSQQDSSSNLVDGRILYFPDSPTVDKAINEFESEVKMTMQAIRDQLQNMTERLFCQERETNDLKQVITELNSENSASRSNKSKKSN